VRVCVPALGCVAVVVDGLIFGFDASFRFLRKSAPIGKSEKNEHLFTSKILPSSP
jgi:hypothetical protein